MARSKKSTSNKKKYTSSLSQHRRIGKTLIPPMLQSPIGDNMIFRSWQDTELPEMLWACLIISAVPREIALNLFVRIAALGFPFRNENQDGKNWSLNHSSIVRLPEDIFDKLVSIVISSFSSGENILRPLLLFESLPGIGRWQIYLKTPPIETDWEQVSLAVAKTLDHQSQESTDIRWLRIMFKAALGKIHVSNNVDSEVIDDIINYHTFDVNSIKMQSVRAIIRSLELGAEIDANTFIEISENQWSNKFWQECLEKTECIFPEFKMPILPETNYSHCLKQLKQLQELLIGHFMHELRTTKLCAKYETVFGYGFYCVALLEELLQGNNNTAILGRLALRTLVECKITLAYLLMKNEYDLWSKYRNFGLGQVKLALLKLEEMKDPPSFLNEKVLEYLANEDSSQEFVSIGLGDWCSADLRKRATESNTKDLYDRYYSLASTYSHGHWGAIRNSCYSICFNPLHRLHRIPTHNGHRFSDDVIPDAVLLVNSILTDVWKAYPSIAHNENPNIKI